jgi:hypothetical protein
MFNSFFCSSHLEHRAPFEVSVITHILRHTVRLLWTTDQPSQGPLPTQDYTIYKQETNIHAPSGIRTRDRSNQAAADLCLRSRSHWDRLCIVCCHHLLWTRIKTVNFHFEHNCLQAVYNTSTDSDWQYETCTNTTPVSQSERTRDLSCSWRRFW